MLVEKKLL